MKYFALLLAAGLVVAVPAMAQPAPDPAACARFDDEIESALKQASNSAVRNRAPEAALYLQSVQTNLSLMTAMRCPLPKTPLATDLYKAQAGKCAVDSIPLTRSDPPPPSCDAGKWKRER